MANKLSNRRNSNGKIKGGGGGGAPATKASQSYSSKTPRTHKKANQTEQSQRKKAIL